MSQITMLLKEMEREAQTTRKMLTIAPNDKYDWKPHPKSMSIRELVGHIAEMPSWVQLVLTTDELDFEKTPYQPTAINDNVELMAFFEKNYTEGYATLQKAKDEDLLPTWTLRSGEQIYVTGTKAEQIRDTYCQVVHHRAQLGVYLRLLNIPIPGSYGPSADELEAMQAAQAN